MRAAVKTHRPGAAGLRVALVLSAGLLLGLTCTGCGLGPDSDSYGAAEFPLKNSSINGLGVFERLCKQAGTRCITVNRLSSRLDKVQAIILIGDTLHPPAKEARDWLEQWLASEPGRCVVYFGRDFDANIYYREQTLARVAPEGRRRARIDLMEAQATLDSQLLPRVEDDAFCRWFTLRIHKPRRDLQPARGPWADALHADSGTWPVRILLEPPDPADAANKPKWPTPGTTTAPVVAPFSPKVQNPGDDEAVVFRSAWEQWDIGDDETWESEWDIAPTPEVLLAGTDGTPLVTRLTSDLYPDSHILTVVNGAPFLNGSLVEPHFRKIAHKIIEDFQPAKRIALLPFDEHGILISLLDEDEDVAGLSVLTTWPMSIVMAHLTWLGILICLALFPILGRPQKPRQRTLSDFGQHAESVGQMLQRTGDLNYALRAIGEYHRTVRGEAVPSWVESALQETTTAHPTAGTSEEEPLEPAPLEPAPLEPAPLEPVPVGPALGPAAATQPASAPGSAASNAPAPGTSFQPQPPSHS